MFENVDHDEFPARNPMADDCRTTGSILPDRDWFMRSARRVWPIGAAKALQFELENSDRTSRAWTSGEYEPPCHVLVQLLRGDHGSKFLDLAMDGASPVWWREQKEWKRKAALADAFAKGLGNAGSNDGDRRRSGSENNVDPGAR